MNPFLIILSMFVAGLALAFSVTGRPRHGIHYAWLTALLLLPSWVDAQIFGSWHLDLRSVAALAGWAGYVIGGCYAPGPRVRLSICDALLSALLIGMVYSQYRSGDLGPTTIPRFVFHWVIPYLVGRHFFGSIDDVPHVERFIAFAIVALTFCGLVEMLSQVNPAASLTGQYFAFLDEGADQRMGMKRAMAMCSHPIFFGLTMVMLLPWAIELWRKARVGEAPRWYRALPLIAFAGVGTSLSRGPVLAGVLTVLVVVFLRLPRLRLALAAMFLIGGTFLWIGSDFVMAQLASVIGENEENAIPIIINGEVERYSGTRHRVLQFKAYGPAIDETGLFGFGDQLLPVRDHYPVHPMFFSIDCAYLLILLRHGWVGLTLFISLGLAAIYRLGRLAWDPSEPLAGLSAGLCGAMAAVSISLISVYLPEYFGGIWLFYVGMARNLDALAEEARLEREWALEQTPELAMVEDSH